MMKTIRINEETWKRLQGHGEGFRGDPMGTPDKVIAALLDREERYQAVVLAAKVVVAEFHAGPDPYPEEVDLIEALKALVPDDPALASRRAPDVFPDGLVFEIGVPVGEEGLS